MVIKALDPDWIRIRIGVQPKMPDPDEMNADPQPCYKSMLKLCCLRGGYKIISCMHARGDEKLLPERLTVQSMEQGVACPVRYTAAPVHNKKIIMSSTFPILASVLDSKF